jgi:uncharacterized protein (DUF1697 family)
MGSPRAAVHVALLRGVNVGGKNRLPMKDLATLFLAAGCEEAQTYIQSGNVVLRAAPAVAGKLARDVEAAIARRFGFSTAVVLRSEKELATALARNPFVAEGVPEDALHLAFLADRPAPAAVASLEPDRSPPDRFAVVGREVYLCCPNGLGRSKLTTAWLDARLGTVATVRNWRTAQALASLAARLKVS